MRPPRVYLCPSTVADDKHGTKNAISLSHHGYPDASDLIPGSNILPVASSHFLHIVRPNHGEIRPCSR